MEHRLLDKGEELNKFFLKHTFCGVNGNLFLHWKKKNRTSIIMEPLRIESEDFNPNRSTTAARSSVVEGGFYWPSSRQCGYIKYILIYFPVIL